MVWIQQLLGDLGFPTKALFAIFCGNQNAMQVYDNPIAHNKMKHVEFHAHYLRQLVLDHVMNLVFCRRDDQGINIFTNPFTEAKFEELQAMLRLQDTAIMEGCLEIISPPKSP